MKDRFDIRWRLVDRLVQRRLRHGFIEVDKKQFLALDQSRTLARHEHHLIPVVAAQAEMSKRVAQSLPINDPQRSDEIVFDGAVAIVDHISLPFSYYWRIRKCSGTSPQAGVLLFGLHQFLKIDERIVGRRTVFLIMHCSLAAFLLIQGPRVLAVVTVHA